MTEKKYAIIENGRVVNVIVWDGVESGWIGDRISSIELLPSDAESVSIGWLWFDGGFFNPDGET